MKHKCYPLDYDVCVKFHWTGSALLDTRHTDNPLQIVIIQTNINSQQLTLYNIEWQEWEDAEDRGQRTNQGDWSVIAWADKYQETT